MNSTKITTVGVHALFDLNGISPNPSFNAIELLTGADVIVLQDVTTGDQVTVFGKDVEVVFDTAVMVIELDFDSQMEVGNLMCVIRSLRGYHDLEI